MQHAGRAAAVRSGAPRPRPGSARTSTTASCTPTPWNTGCSRPPAVLLLLALLVSQARTFPSSEPLRSMPSVRGDQAMP